MHAGLLFANPTKPGFFRVEAQLFELDESFHALLQTLITVHARTLKFDSYQLITRTTLREQDIIMNNINSYWKYGLRHEKTVFRVWHQLSCDPVCSASETGYICN